VIIALGALAAVIVLSLVIAILGGISGSDGVAAAFRILRDFFIIVLALQGILISVALIVLILQLSALVNLLRSEIKPIIDETRQTLTTVRGTAQFVSQNVAEPVIKVSAAVAGARAFIGELAGIRRNINGEHTRSNGRR
jgi:amino acid permease